MTSRRKFIGDASLLTAGLLMAGYISKAAGNKKPVILIVSGWQDVNIGDIAHTPGLIELLRRKIPDCTIILWKKSKSEKVETMLQRHYPEVKIIHGKVNKDFSIDPSQTEVVNAFQQADYFIHGSGPYVVAEDFLHTWVKNTSKPFGIFGVTIDKLTPSLKELLPQAKFIFTRETASIEVLKKNGLEGEHISFAPDATFSLNIKDDDKALKFMAENNLTAKKFICVVPRLRKTPYYKINPDTRWSEATIKGVDELNAKWKEIDHAKLREAMVTWVRKTGNKIVVCPEMTYQVEIMDELLITPLPDDVKPYVVKHDYWLTDEAASLYTSAHTVISFECHSPIIAATNGTPCFYLRQPEDTIKGQMYYDLGLSDWTFEINDTTGQQISDRLMQVYNDYKTAKKNNKQAMAKTDERYKKAFALINTSLKTT